MFKVLLETLKNRYFPLVREKYIIRKLNKYIKTKEKVLDIGCGNGKLSSKLKKKKNLKILGIDTKKTTNLIPFLKIDGKKMPFKNNEFDCAILIDVLHHENNIKKLLKEASRVSRRVIIKDHFYKTEFQKVILTLVDTVSNLKNIKTIKYNFLKIEEWKNLFKSLNLKIVEVDVSPMFKKFDIIKHVFFVVKKQ